MENNRQTIMNIYTILKKYSSAEHPMNASDIARRMTKEWVLQKAPNRKTITTHLLQLLDLTELGMLDNEVKTVGDIRKTGYYIVPPFQTSEIKLLCDAIASSRFISRTQSKGLIEKLGRSHGEEFISKYNYILELKKSQEKSYNSALFESIELISESIESRTKVTFQYLKYDLNKKLVPRNKEKNGYITVSPYNLIWTLNHYYLFCQLDETGDDRFLRVDKIVNVRKEEQRINPHHLQQDTTVRDYSRNQAYMFGGEMERIKFRCQMRMLDQIIDFFGEDAEIKPIDDDYFEVEVVTSIDSIKYWALQYITAIDKIQPVKLHEIIVGYLEDALVRNR